MEESMKVKLILFQPFREIFNTGEGEVELSDASDVQALLNILCNTKKRHEKIFNDSGELKSYIIILKNGQSIKMLNGVQTELEEGDEIAIFPPVAGG